MGKGIAFVCIKHSTAQHGVLAHAHALDLAIGLDGLLLCEYSEIHDEVER